MNFKTIFALLFIFNLLGNVQAAEITQAETTQTELNRYEIAKDYWNRRQSERASGKVAPFDIEILKKEASVREFRQEIIASTFGDLRDEVEKNHIFYKSAFGVSLLYGWLLNKFEEVITPFYVGKYFSFNTMFKELTAKLCDENEITFLVSRFTMGLAAIEQDRFGFLFDGIIPLHYAIDQVRKNKKTDAVADAAEPNEAIKCEAPWQTPQELFRETLRSQEKAVQENKGAQTGYAEHLWSADKTTEGVDKDLRKMQIFYMGRKDAQLASLNTSLNSKLNENELMYIDIILSLPSCTKNDYEIKKGMTLDYYMQNNYYYYTQSVESIYKYKKEKDGHEDKSPEVSYKNPLAPLGKDEDEDEDEDHANRFTSAAATPYAESKQQDSLVQGFTATADPGYRDPSRDLAYAFESVAKESSNQSEKPATYSSGSYQIRRAISLRTPILANQEGRGRGRGRASQSQRQNPKARTTQPDPLL